MEDGISDRAEVEAEADAGTSAGSSVGTGVAALVIDAASVFGDLSASPHTGLTSRTHGSDGEIDDADDAAVGDCSDDNTGATACVDDGGDGSGGGGGGGATGGGGMDGRGGRVISRRSPTPSVIGTIATTNDDGCRCRASNASTDTDGRRAGAAGGLCSTSESVAPSELLGDSDSSRTEPTGTTTPASTAVTTRPPPRMALAVRRASNPDVLPRRACPDDDAAADDDDDDDALCCACVGDTCGWTLRDGGSGGIANGAVVAWLPRAADVLGDGCLAVDRLVAPAPVSPPYDDSDAELTCMLSPL